MKKLLTKDMRPGLVFKDLVTVRPTDKKYKNSIIWECVCLRCGKTKFITSDRLLFGNDRSCGCFKAEHNKNIKETLHFIDGTCLEWIANRKHRSDNTSGFRGVSQCKRDNKWVVTLGFQGKKYNLGRFKNFNDAVNARLDAEDKYFKPFIEKHKDLKNDLN